MARSQFIMILWFMRATLCAAQAAVKPNWNKLTDFSTSYSFDGKDLGKMVNALSMPYAGLLNPISSIEASGELHVDVFGEKFLMTASGKVTYSGDPKTNLPPILLGATIEASGEMSFSAPGGFASCKINAGTGPTPFSGDLCANVHFPQGLFPPEKLLKAQVSAFEKMVDRRAARMPHTEVTVDGKSTALFPSSRDCKTNCFYAGFLQDGTPVGLGFAPASHGEWTPLLKFTGWTEGAGEVAPVCGNPSSTDLVDTPRGKATLAMFDHVMANLQNMETMREHLRHFPAQPSVIFVSAAASKVSPSSQDTQQTWLVVALASVAGALSSVIFLAVVKKTAATVTSHRQPLLADVA